MKIKTLISHSSFTGTISTAVVLLAAYGAHAQNMFVTDWNGSGRILEFAPGSQTFSTFNSGDMSEPGGLAFNSAGILFVANTSGGSIDELTSGGTLSTFATGLQNPSGLAFDSAGDLFDTDFSGNAIYEFVNNHGTLSSTPTLFVSGLSHPTMLAFDSAGNMFETDASGNKINEFKNTGGTLSATPITYASNIIDPFGLAFNAAGDLYVSYDSPSGTSGGVTEFLPGNSQKTILTGLVNPNDIAFDNAGDLFVMDAGNGDIDEVAANGTTSSFATNAHVFGVAFQGITLPVPEPSTWALAAMGAGALLIYRHQKTKKTGILF
jgi:sugar lactone lactonase YvrE